MRVAVLDYRNGLVYTAIISNKVENVEDYLSKKLKLKKSEMSYMASDNLDIINLGELKKLKNED